MPPPKDAVYTRRAAANMLNRLKAAPDRLNKLPSLHNMVFDESKKSELITILVENQGNLEKVQAFLQFQEEKGTVEMTRKKAVRYTKKQMQDIYGEDAEKVMKHKEEMGLTEEDENNPEGIVYLFAKKSEGTENYKRSGILARQS